MLGQDATVDGRETGEGGGEVEEDERSYEEEKVSGQLECVHFLGDGHVH
jgi:hypothetical protein